MKEYDLIVVGTGAGNIVLEAALAKGLKCAQIEKGKFGGTCLTRGCIPTKVLVTAADFIREAQKIERIGIAPFEKPRIDWEKLSHRVWAKINESKELEQFYMNEKNLDVYKGCGYFTGEKSMKVALASGGVSEEITAKVIVLAVGGRTKIPNIEGLEEVGYLTSENLFGKNYPKSAFRRLIIIGGGPIGTEFAHVFSAAGSKVTIIQHNVRLLPKEDVQVSEKLLENIREFGIGVELNQDTISVRREGEDKVLLIRDIATGEEKEIRADEILVAPGIVSNADLLHLERTKVTVDRRGYIETNEFLETNTEGIYALGDCNGKAPFRHKANYEADILSHNLYLRTEENGWRFAEYDLVPAVTYTYPQVGHVGMTKEQAEAAGYTVSVGLHHYSQTSKGYSLGMMEGEVDDGFVKVIVEKKSGKILGAHVIGEQASILFQPFLNLMNAGKHLLRAIHPEIGSEQTKVLRAKKYVRNLEPNVISTINETMVPHPALSEVAMWTQYYVDYEE